MTTLKKISHIVADYPLRLINRPIEQSQWFKNLFVAEDGEVYPNNKWYREHDERNFDLVVLGSSSGKWAFDFTNSDIKAMNWAQAPQTLVEDYNILCNFHSILRNGGFVIITIMPFTSLNKETGIYDAIKYLKISTHKPIEPHLLDQAYRLFRHPIRMGEPAIKAGIRYLIKKELPIETTGKFATSTPMTEQQLEHNAQGFVTGWKRQFGIQDFEAPLTEKNLGGRTFRIHLMQTIIDFCIERGYQPIYLIPPVTDHLAKHFSPRFEELYIYSFLKEVERKIPLFDYSKVPEFKDDQLFFNSFFLNQKGRRLFTDRVLKDLHIK